MTHDINDNCGNCKFWTGDRRDNRGQGDCRAHPPQACTAVPMQNPLSVRKEMSLQLLFGTPQVSANYWCGEFTQVDSLIQ